MKMAEPNDQDITVNAKDFREVSNMSDNQKRFSELYKLREGEFNEEMQELFSTILADDFNNNPLLMDEFIFSLNTPETPQQPQEPQEPTNSDLQKQIAEMQATIDQLIDIITS